VISVRQLSYAFRGAQPLSFPDLQVAGGEQLLLLGQSGSGKTTLLHLMGGLRRNYQGSIRIGETELSTLSPAELDHFRGQHIGFIFQRHHLIQALDVEDNLRMAPYLAGMRVDQQRIAEVLNHLGLTAHRHKKINQLSQGQAQRVAIARAVINKPSILFADEPTSALDDANCQLVADLLKDVARESDAVLIVATHDRRLMDQMQKQIQLT